jgi:hypothetical protein
MMIFIYMYSVCAEWLAMCSSSPAGAGMFKRQACFDKQLRLQLRGA